MTIVWEMLAMAGALVGGLLLLFSFTTGSMAMAAQGIGLAAIPYFIASIARRGIISDYLKRMAEGD